MSPDLLAIKAIVVSGPPGGSGEAWTFWIVCAFMLFGVLSFAYLRWRKATATSRGFYDKSIMIVSVAAVAYMAMALGVAYIHPIGIKVPDQTNVRIYLPRYADWTITTPLLLLDVILFAKPLLNKGWQWDAAFIIGMDLLMIATGVVAGLLAGSSRWFFFWASMLAYVVVASYVFVLFRKSRLIPEPLVANKLRTLTAMLSVLWFCYPFVFALYFGGAFNGTTEDICFGVLDVLAKVGFGFVLLMGPAVELVDKVRNVAPPAEESERPLERGRSAGVAR